MSLQHVIQRLAHMLSIAFHPIFIPMAMAYVVLDTSPFRYPVGDYRFIVPLLLTGIFTIIYPIFMLLICRGLGLVKSVDLRERRDRIVPYIAISSFVFWAYFMMRKGSDPVIGQIDILTYHNPLFEAMFLGVFFTLVLLLLCTLFWKVSAHAASSVAFVLLVYHLAPYSNESVLPWFIVSILVAGFSAASRLYLKAHSLEQVITGWVLGIVGMSLGFFWVFDLAV
ncbi:MAG: phosphatase PAP2 family protein [Chitinophagales bacterium]